MSGAAYKGMDPVKVSGAVTPSCYADRSLFAWAGSAQSGLRFD